MVLTVDLICPQFLSDDIELFQGITSDLFPGVTLPTPDYASLEEALTTEMAARDLQPVPWFIVKIIQVSAINCGV